MLETIQRDSVISFPMLGNLRLNPPSYFTIFGHPIYFYGVIIGIAFLLGILFSSKRAKRFGLKEDDIYDAAIWGIPCAIIGARLYYVLFQLGYYRQHPDEILAIRNGGLAIYGGVIAGVLAVFFVSRRKKIPFPAMLDCLCYGLRGDGRLLPHGPDRPGRHHRLRTSYLFIRKPLESGRAAVSALV